MINIQAQHRLTADEIRAMPSVFSGEYVPTVCKTVESRAAFLTEFMHRAKLLGMHGEDNVPVYQVRQGQKLCFFSVGNNDIQYFMRLNPLHIIIADGVEHAKLLPTTGVYQGSVWRNDDIVMFGGPTLARAIFWRLQKSNRTLWSDITQSKDGKLFWHRRIGEAMDKGLRVLAVNFSPLAADRAIVEKIVPIIHKQDALPYWTNETADSSDIGLYWRFAIV